MSFMSLHIILHHFASFLIIFNHFYIIIISKEFGNFPNNLEKDVEHFQKSRNHFQQSWKNSKIFGINSQNIWIIQKKLEKFQIFWNWIWIKVGKIPNYLESFPKYLESFPENFKYFGIGFEPFPKELESFPKVLESFP